MESFYLDLQSLPANESFPENVQNAEKIAQKCPQKIRKKCWLSSFGNFVKTLLCSAETDKLITD